MKNSFTYLSLFLISTICFSAEWKTFPGIGQLSIIESSNSMFPHQSRTDGHIYKDSLYSFIDHYNDSSVAIFLPEKYRSTDSIDLVFYFHGWNNNISKAIEKFKLLEQFNQSGKNAVLVFPEGPKNAPDSFGGKLEENEVFKNLVADVLGFLRNESKTSSIKPGRIILAGHSGAYRVISFILNRGGLTDNITEVYLFDALYAQMQKYAHWLNNSEGRFINIITPNGGTFNSSSELLADFTDWKMPFYRHDKNEITESELQKEKIIFLFSELSHSAVINPYFKLFLKTSSLNNN